MVMLLLQRLCMTKGSLKLAICDNVAIKESDLPSSTMRPLLMRSSSSVRRSWLVVKERVAPLKAFIPYWSLSSNSNLIALCVPAMAISSRVLNFRLSPLTCTVFATL